MSGKILNTNKPGSTLKSFKTLLNAKHLVFLALFISIWSLISCGFNKDKKVVVDFASPSPDSAMISFHQDMAVHVAIASMSSPRESIIYYSDLLDYISSIINIPIHYVQKESYEEVNLLLEQGAVDFAFICSGAYVDAVASQNVDILVAPIVNEKTFYRSYVITQKDSPIQSFEDLKGNSFAFSDPMSNTGYYYPLMLLKGLGSTIDDFFERVIFTYGHDLSIQMVNRGIIDGAAVNGLIYDYMLKFQGEKVENTKVTDRSEWFGIPPIVTPKNLDPGRYKLYQKIFLDMHKNDIGKQILYRLNVDQYTKVDDSIYDNVRAIKAPN